MFKGWRHATKHLGDAERRVRDQGWIAEYGEEAYDTALKATEWVLKLAYPPPPCPVQTIRSSGGQAETIRSSGAHATWDDPQTVVVRAAWGGPELWPAQRIDTADVTQLLALRTRTEHRAAINW